VTAVATSFHDTKLLTGPALRKARVTGNPVRDQVIDWATQSYQPPHRNGPFSLLVFGGSQGARYFADAVPPAIGLLPDDIKTSLFVVQQCREEDLQRVEAAYEAANVRAHLATFFDNLPDEMAKAHLVIARSGASTVAELAVMGRPAILVPLPHAIDNDQLQNARRLADSGGAWCMEQKNLTSETLSQAIGRLFVSPEILLQAAAAAKAQGRPDAVTRLADLVLELIGPRTELSEVQHAVGQ
jgi:UDP-N-acetylglucosamine--N-acetylmuramyl-(pentapeptide) pyrophosphoryl-undecaprenol N-acetylglucosamine transferase